MATIKISDLHPTGVELFSDSESYIGELSNGEIDLIKGGWVVAVSRLTIWLITPEIPHH